MNIQDEYRMIWDIGFSLKCKANKIITKSKKKCPIYHRGNPLIKRHFLGHPVYPNPKFLKAFKPYFFMVPIFYRTSILVLNYWFVINLSVKSRCKVEPFYFHCPNIKKYKQNFRIYYPKLELVLTSIMLSPV